MSATDVIAAVRREMEADGETVTVGLYDSTDEVLLVLRAAPGRVTLCTVEHDELVVAEITGRHDMLDVIQVVHLLDGTVHVPLLTWVEPRCSWPGCTRRRRINGMRFQDGRLCEHHEDEANDRMAEAADEAGR